MSDKPKINLRRFEPQKIPAKYWVKFLIYSVILTALYFWYKHKTQSVVKPRLEQNELNLKGVEVENVNLDQ